MKIKITQQVLRIPNTDKWMVQKQYLEGGTIHTDDNNGKGYTEDEAHKRLMPVILAQPVSD